MSSFHDISKLNIDYNHCAYKRILIEDLNGGASIYKIVADTSTARVCLI